MVCGTHFERDLSRGIFQIDRDKSEFAQQHDYNRSWTARQTRKRIFSFARINVGMNVRYPIEKSFMCCEPIIARQLLEIWVQISFYRLAAYTSFSSFDFTHPHPLAIGLQRVLHAFYLLLLLLLFILFLLLSREHSVFSCGTEPYFGQLFFPW